MRDHQLRKITVEPGLPSDLVRNTLEGAMLWGILDLSPEDEPSNGIIEVSHNAVKGVGVIAYSLGGGTAAYWIELAKLTRSKFANAALEFFSKGDEFHKGVFDLNRCVDECGINPLSLTKILQSILINHGDKVETDHFIVRISPTEFDEDVSFGAAFITADKITHLNIDRWIEKMKRDHKSKPTEPSLIF
ncbi:hypothetical protein [Rhizobium sp. MHM7A]|uniref:hypothetical protein n=1 Tax=Rhizobium sp. MHM7A TaxID=2583233 RepID=UPI001106445D|nr:hypothetical protein [Rhizobium sp. MHM7A]TLX15984.1 hypothetical protein FFR93_01315 [Rhizobium sp. MHM7A]